MLKQECRKFVRHKFVFDVYVEIKGVSAERAQHLLVRGGIDEV